MEAYHLHGRHVVTAVAFSAVVHDDNGLDGPNFQQQVNQQSTKPRNCKRSMQVADLKGARPQCTGVSRRP